MTDKNVAVISLFFRASPLDWLFNFNLSFRILILTPLLRVEMTTSDLIGFCWHFTL